MLRKISFVFLCFFVFSSVLLAGTVVRRSGILEKVYPDVGRVVIDGQPYLLADGVRIQSSEDADSFLSIWDLRSGYTVHVELYPDRRGEMRIEKMVVIITQQ
jgi:hypothetical protein